MQSFKIELLIKTDCEAILTEKQIKEWIEKQLTGFDIGTTKVCKVEER